MKNKKTDRRTLYTIKVIKDAFLAAIDTEPFNKVTITQICHLAEITRSTFYIHYNSINDLLDAVLDDVLFLADQETANQLDDSNNSLLTTCQRIGSNPKYRKLLMEPDLTEYIINRIIQREGPKVIPSIMKKAGISKAEAKMLFSYTIHGSFAVSKVHQFEMNDNWLHDAKLLNNFTKAGYLYLKEDHSSLKSN